MKDEEEVSFSAAAVKGILTQYSREVVADYKQSQNKKRLIDTANRHLARIEYEHLLENTIPIKRKDGSKDGRYKKYKTLARFFDKARLSDRKVKTYLLLRELITPVRTGTDSKRKVSKSDYAKIENRKKYNEILKNRLKILNKKFFVPTGYRVKFGTDQCTVVRINEKPLS